MLSGVNSGEFGFGGNGISEKTSIPTPQKKTERPPQVRMEMRAHFRR